MRRYIVRRALAMIPVLVLVTFVVFALTMLLPGDPVEAYMGLERADREVVAALRAKWGLDQPIPVQYAKWLGNALQGDLGRSTKTGEPVLQALLGRAPVTLQLGVLAFVLSLFISIPVGVVSAIRRGSSLDVAGTVFAMLGVAMPGFWLGIMLILVFAVMLGWLPPSGYVSFFDNPVTALKYLILPAFCLGLQMSAINMRQMRSALLEVLGQDYIRTARAKGLAERTVIGLHALKNSMLPVVTIMGMQVGRILGGAVIIETVFAIPGMGRLAVWSVFARDFPMVQGTVLVIAVAVLLVNLLTDLLYGYLDPRISYM